MRQTTQSRCSSPWGNLAWACSIPRCQRHRFGAVGAYDDMVLEIFQIQYDRPGIDMQRV